jgi:3D (Asp-Asp-Asp) domain-containing protein
MAKFKHKIKKLNKKLGFIWQKLNNIFLVIIILELIFPQVSLAQNIEAKTMNNIENIPPVQIVQINNPEIKLPENGNRLPGYKTSLIATAYNSLPSQTDNSPCMTASGFNLCEHNEENIIATNFLPIGTHIKIPGLYGDKIFRVEDRMHSKYYKQIDIWFKDYDDAVRFGAKWVEIEVY